MIEELILNNTFNGLKIESILILLI